MLDAVAAAALDVEPLERGALGGPGLACGGWEEAVRCELAGGERAGEGGLPTTSLSRLRPLARAWSRARASIESSREAGFLGETCVEEWVRVSTLQRDLKLRSEWSGANL